MTDRYEEEYIKWSSMTFSQIRTQLVQLNLNMPLKDAGWEYTRKSRYLIEKILRMTVPLSEQPFGKLLIVNECFSFDAYSKYFAGHRCEEKYSDIIVAPGNLRRAYGGRFGFQLIDPDSHLYYGTIDEFNNACVKLGGRGYNAVDFRESIWYMENPRFPPDGFCYYPEPVDRWRAPR